jgi:hypothetical protein
VPPGRVGPDRRTAVFARITLADLHVAAGEPSGATLAEQVIRDVAACPGRPVLAGLRRHCVIYPTSMTASYASRVALVLGRFTVELDVQF